MSDGYTRYEYVLVRYMHDYVSEEFVNIGVIMYAPDQGKIYARITERFGRLSDFFPDFKGAGYRSLARHIQRACLRLDAELREGLLFQEAPSRAQGVGSRVVDDSPQSFYGRSSADQREELPLQGRPSSVRDVVRRVVGGSPYSSFKVSGVRYGMDRDLEHRLSVLYEEFIARYEHADERSRRDESAITRDLDQKLISAGLGDRLTFAYRLDTDTYGHEFHAAWRNGTTQVLEPVSLDLAVATRIVDKANLWSGRLATLSQAHDFSFTGVVAPPTSPDLGVAYDKAITILRKAPRVRNIVEERNTESVLSAITEDLRSQPDQSLR